MEQHFQDAEHYARVIAGLENMDLAYAGVEALNDDGRYAQTTLRRLAQFDLGSYAGNEALSDKIKAGAAAAVEWIKKLVAAIKAAAKAASEMWNKNKIEEANRKMREAARNKALQDSIEKDYQSYVSPLETALGILHVADKHKSAALGQMNDFSPLIAKLTKARDAAKAADINFGNELYSTKHMLEINIGRVGDALEAYVAKNGKDKESAQGVSNLNTLNSVMKKLVGIAGKYDKDAADQFERAKATDDENEKDRAGGKKEEKKD